jgi:hypothetical protein
MPDGLARRDSWCNMCTPLLDKVHKVHYLKYSQTSRWPRDKRSNPQSPTEPQDGEKGNGKPESEGHPPGPKKAKPAGGAAMRDRSGMPVKPALTSLKQSGPAAVFEHRSGPCLNP